MIDYPQRIDQLIAIQTLPGSKAGCWLTALELFA